MPLWQPSKVLARPAYYDRDPLMVQGGYNSSLAPHATTLRISYAPPFQRAAFVELINLFIIRVGVAGAAGLSALWWQASLAGSGVFYKVAYSAIDNVAVATSNQNVVTSLGYFAYNDQLQAYTLDAATGGTVYYDTSFKGTEFLY